MQYSVELDGQLFTMSPSLVNASTALATGCSGAGQSFAQADSYASRTALTMLCQDLSAGCWLAAAPVNGEEPAYLMEMSTCPGPESSKGRRGRSLQIDETRGLWAVAWARDQRVPGLGCPGKGLHATALGSALELLVTESTSRLTGKTTCIPSPPPLSLRLSLPTPSFLAPS